MQKTLTTRTEKEVPTGYDEKTLSGEQKQRNFRIQKRKWMRLRPNPRSTRKNEDIYCARGDLIKDYLCPEGDKLVALGGPKEPEYIPGVDTKPATKTVSKKVETPNPDYLKFKETAICYSDRAAKPGAVWAVGSHSTMPREEWWPYRNYLGIQC